MRRRTGAVGSGKRDSDGAHCVVNKLKELSSQMQMYRTRKE